MNITHDPGRHLFQLSLPEGDAVLEYALVPPNAVNFVHTFVPETLRGRGYAEELVKAGLAWAQSQSLQVTASCSYVARHLKRHPLGLQESHSRATAG